LLLITDFLENEIYQLDAEPLRAQKMLKFFHYSITLIFYSAVDHCFAFFALFWIRAFGKKFIQDNSMAILHLLNRTRVQISFRAV